MVVTNQRKRSPWTGVHRTQAPVPATARTRKGASQRMKPSICFRDWEKSDRTSVRMEAAANASAMRVWLIRKAGRAFDGVIQARRQPAFDIRATQAAAVSPRPARSDRKRILNCFS